MSRPLARILAPLVAMGLVLAAPMAQANPPDQPLPSERVSGPVGGVVSGPASQAHPRMLFGWAHVGPGAPVVDATVRMLTRGLG